MGFELRKYQQKGLSEITDSLKQHRRVLAVYPTGAGKSVIISNLAEYLSGFGRVLILTHRTEILSQNAKVINKDSLGILTSKHNYRTNNKIIVAMVETFHARIKKHGELYIGKFDYIIVDEAHILTFSKVYENLPYKNLIGFTATPVTNKRTIIQIDDKDYIKNWTMGDYYDKLIVGPSVKELINMGYLVPERAFTMRVEGFDRLKKGSNGDYTAQSLDQVYNNTVQIKKLIKIYKQLSIKEDGTRRKTLIFNANTKINDRVRRAFRQIGIMADSYDSVNNSVSDRNDVVNWFKSTPGSVLIGTNVFTTGLDVTDIELLIVNRATTSLSLWIQMVGRGSRLHEGKRNFISVDLGNNIDEFGKWSDDIDWHSLFEVKEPVPKRKVDLLDIWECANCGTYNISSDKFCIKCEEPKDKVTSAKAPDKNGVLIEVGSNPPVGREIVDYAIRMNETSNFAFKLLEARIIDLFVSNHVSKQSYIKNKTKFRNRVKRIYTPIYMSIIRSKLQGSNKRLDTQLKRMYNKIDRIYGD